LVSVVGGPRLCFPPFFPVLHRASDEDDADIPRSCAYRAAHLAAKAIASRLARHMLAQTYLRRPNCESFCPRCHALTQDLTVPRVLQVAFTGHQPLESARKTQTRWRPPSSPPRIWQSTHVRR
jgi:hypothetical protein